MLTIYSQHSLVYTGEGSASHPIGLIPEEIGGGWVVQSVWVEAQGVPWVRNPSTVVKGMSVWATVVTVFNGPYSFVLNNSRVGLIYINLLNETEEVLVNCFTILLSFLEVLLEIST